MLTSRKCTQTQSTGSSDTTNTDLPLLVDWVEILSQASLKNHR